jgi:hypothetical protein
MKSCFNCRHLYQCRLDYDRVYPCKDWTDDSKTKKKTDSDSTQTDQTDEGDTAGRCETSEGI